MKLLEALRDIIGTPVYHHTFEDRGIQIIRSNSMKGTKPFDDLIDKDPILKASKYQMMISFTRDKNFTPGPTIGLSADKASKEQMNMIFVLDLNKLKTKYRVVPFDYSSLEDIPIHNSKEDFLNWLTGDMETSDVNPTRKEPRKGKNDEVEERVLTNVIYPLRPYVIDIIYKGDNPEVKQLIKDYLG